MCICVVMVVQCGGFVRLRFGSLSVLSVTSLPVCWPDVVNQGKFGFVRVGFLGVYCVYLWGSCVYLLGDVGLFCQYHSQVIGWKDSSLK